ncbi:trigger factor [Ktedonosporobacter rubrisoli]|uniref:trigger factor n=1 Tax=Ktedonosporobacter rubrisoli TaxID=2509675 RepID=UPI0013EEDB8E|nr:trigger factor [Ktedonosporobacter rubrisoli]
MKVSVEKLPSSEAVLEVDVTWDEMEKASDKAYRKLVQKVDVQGFRRGKAPRAMLERKLGREYIYQEGLDDLITEAYRNTLKEHDLTPITQPKLDAPIFEMGQPYHFSLTVPIITPVELPDYKSMHFDREEVDVTSEEVDKEIESLRTRVAEWNVVERPAAIGDRVTVDLKLTSGDQQISDLKDNPFELTDERNGLFTGMDEHIVGMQAGESKNFSTTIPADYSNEKLAGKEANYAVTLHKVEEKQLPELDDAFAEKVSDGQCATVEDLSKVLSDNILENKKRRVREELREKVVSSIIEQSTFNLHPLLIDEEIEDMMHQFSHMLEQQRLSMDQYLMMTRKTAEEYREELRPEAENRVKRQLVLEEVARQENVTVDPEEIEALFNFYAQAGQALPRSDEQIRALALSYRREKTLTRLVELTTDPDPEAVSEEEEAEEAVVENAQVAAQEGAAAAEEAKEDVGAATPREENGQAAQTVE